MKSRRSCVGTVAFVKTLLPTSRMTEPTNEGDLSAPILLGPSVTGPVKRIKIRCWQSDSSFIAYDKRAIKFPGSPPQDSLHCVRVSHELARVMFGKPFPLAKFRKCTVKQYGHSETSHDFWPPSAYHRARSGCNNFSGYMSLHSLPENSLLLSRLVADNPAVSDFWSLERCVSAAARRFPNSQQVSLQCDVEPEFRCTPRRWQMILTAAHERGLRARTD